jgi:hypothetical protein
MTLKEFILSAPKQDDESINHVLDLLTGQKDLPEDVKTISKVIYLKLNPQQTQAFQKIIMMYYFTENNYQQPTAQNLDEINFIIELQNNDVNYPFK